MQHCFPKMINKTSCLKIQKICEPLLTFFKKVDNRICLSFDSKLISCISCSWCNNYFLCEKCSKMSLDLRGKFHCSSLSPPRKLKDTKVKMNANVQLLWLSFFSNESGNLQFVKWNLKKSDDKSSLLNLHWSMMVYPVFLVKYLLTDLN